MLFAASHVLAQIHAQTPYLWPIKDAKAGENILYFPQDLVDNELNSELLIVSAPEGSIVVAPSDGIFGGYSMTYKPLLQTLYSYGHLDGSKSIDERKAELIASGNLDKSLDPKYITGMATVRTSDGNAIHITGLSGDQKFKPGQQIKRGTPIGRVAHGYFKIAEPSILIEADKNGRKADPMTPFGLKTTYKPFVDPKPVTSLTKEQAVEDFTIYIDALKECFTGLYNVVSPEELDEYVETAIAKINSRRGNIPYGEFRAIIEETVAKVHDSHIHLYPPEWKIGGNSSYMPAIWFGFFSDTLRLSNATEQFKDLIGRQIVSVNNIPADSIKRIIGSKIDGYDARTESFKQYMLAIPAGMIRYFREPYLNTRRDMKIRFADEDEINIPGIQRAEWISNHWKFMTINNDYPGNFQTKMLNDRTAYLGLKSFWLSQVETEKIAAFIDSIAAVPNLVIDMRNNIGGDGAVLGKLYSYIAGDPMTLHGFSKVNSNTKYKVFKYATNYPHDTEMFSDYRPEEGKDGFYQRSEAGSVVRADSLVNYKGRIYMLTNAKSVSAATLLPAMLVRNHRGVTVGRETASAYHFMNAVKFVDIQLPASLIKIRLPLVETHFDNVVNERVPYGRGVIPDYPVELSMEELFSGNDVILDYTLGLIERGEYFRSGDPFAKPESEKKSSLPVLMKISIAAMLIATSVAACGYVSKKRRILKK